MRAPSSLAAAALLALTACGDDDAPPGKAAGEPCLSERECQRGLVCFERTCASGYPPSPGCTLPAAPTLVRGDPVDLPPPPANTCVTTVREPVPAGTFLDLGEHPVGTTLTFDLPPGSSGFTILSQEVGDTAVDTFVYRGFLFPNSVVPTNVREPGGALFFSDTDPYPTSGRYDSVTGVLAYYGGFSPVSGSFTVPNTAAGLDLARAEGELPAGTWSFTVNDWALECRSIPSCSVDETQIGVYRVHVYPRPGPFASTGTLDLEVYLATDSTGLLPDATAAAANPQMTRWVRGLGAHLAKAGICLGTVTLHDIPAWAKTRYAAGGVVDISGGGMGLPPAQTPPGCDDLSQLFTVAIAQRRAVHVFLADELRDASVPAGFTVLGVDGSIPGPSGAPGTVNGGAVVGVFDLLGAEVIAGACDGTGPSVPTCGTDALAYVAAHETGHWLGLYHTTEIEGTTFDPLSDTATCACLSCAPRTLRWRCTELDPIGFGTEVLNAYCSGSTSHCGGGRNLMFWLFDDAFATGELTRQQGEVMRLNPAVR